MCFKARFNHKEIKTCSDTMCPEQGTDIWWNSIMTITNSEKYFNVFVGELWVWNRKKSEHWLIFCKSRSFAFGSDRNEFHFKKSIYVKLQDVKENLYETDHLWDGKIWIKWIQLWIRENKEPFLFLSIVYFSSLDIMNTTKENTLYILK